MSEAVLEVLEGELRNIVFANETGEFTVARITTEDGKLKTAVGNLAGVKPGEFVRLKGEWAQNPKYGAQFQVKSYLVQSPKTMVGLERYLASGILPGVGPKTAERIVKCFGKSTLEVIENSPEKLRQIEGIGSHRVDQIIGSWQGRKALSEVMVFLQSCGISPAFAERIHRLYKDQAVALLRQNPYRLAWEVHGIGFKKADQIALEMGIDPKSPLRCEAAVLYVLRAFGDQGHVFYPLDAILRETTQMLEVNEEAVGEGIQRALREERIRLEEVSWDDEITGTPWRGQVLYLDKMYHAELGAATALRKLLAEATPAATPQQVTQLLEELQDRHGLDLGEEQREALQQTLGSRVSIITGGPGTGKTTMVRALVHILKDRGLNVLLAAPTGRAAKRLNETTGEEAKTLHRLLEYRPRERQFARNAKTPLELDWLIVDETSMVDIFLIQHLLNAMPAHGSLLLVGDVDQLPSVGSGNVLKDIIDSGMVPVSRLQQIYRQAEGSLITLNAHSVNRGEFPKLIPLEKQLSNAAPENPDADPLDDDSGLKDCYFVKEELPAKMVEKIRWLYTEELPKRFHIDPLLDAQVITPMHKGDVGSQNLNRMLQEALNPPSPRRLAEEVRLGEKTFRLGDRVMQLRNNYDKEVFNGDIGQIVFVDLEAGEVRIRFDYVEPTYTLGELGEVELAYAVTVHKSQGSEYPVVVLPLSTQHFIMLQRNLLYTALTRGKSLVILVGSTKAVAIALKNDRMARRYTMLAKRIREATI